MELIKNANINFVSKNVRRGAFLFSGILILIGIVSFIIGGGFNLGIDFAGGSIIQYKFEERPPLSELRDVLKEAGLGKSIIQTFGNPKEVVMKLSEGSDVEHLKNIMHEKYGEGADIRREETVGPSIGRDLKNQAFWAVLWSLVGILIYISWRFELKYAIGAIAALFHDVLITLGAFALFKYEFNTPVLAAILTIIGYSLNDTIVVFDRIRENIRIERPRSTQHYEGVVNGAINASLSRTVITSLTTLFVVIVLFFFGGEVLRNFSFALLIGIIVGTYSSVFIASPILIEAHLRVGAKK
ncbi:protein translocase subunit SecF [Candidatus Mcinerneyibacteriota bacterium]|nr:protein translocase subunit SecF [Candidatus Mcinerneyibacteriota bacterium]